MTLEEALAEIAKLKEDATKLNERFVNAESVIGRQGVELGDLRKYKTEASATITTLTGDIETLKKEKGGSTTAGNQQTEEADPDKLEAALTKDQATVLDEAWKRAPEETRKRIVSDPKVRVAFIQEAAKVASTVPDTWRKTTRQVEDTSRSTVDEIKNLFSQHRPNRSTPTAGRAGAVREAAGREGGSGDEIPALNPSDISGSLRKRREALAKK